MSVYFQGVNQRGFGTYPLTGKDGIATIETAIETGYRAIDTAQMYGNEAETGQALRNAGLPRDAFCVTTKVHPDNFSQTRFLPSVERSLKDLGLAQVDVLLLHWPPEDGVVAASLKLLQAAHDRGLARHIGVSNYTSAMLRTALDTLATPLSTNQIEFHPLLDQSRLLAAASAMGVPISSYCSVARGAVFDHPLFADIGAPHGKSAAQVTLRWILQKGVSMNTMSTKPANIRANFDIMDFALSNVDMARIDALGRTGHRIVTSDKVVWAPEWD